MRIEFEKQLKQLNAEMASMGIMCETAVDYAAQAILDGDEETALRVYGEEKRIEQKEKYIESLCMNLILRQQPVAADLRTISAAFKIVSDMARIGTQAEDIAEILKHIKDFDMPRKDNLRKMAEAASSMISGSVKAFVEKDADLAIKVIEDDDIVDGYFMKVKEELIVMISEGPRLGGLYLDMMMIAKYLERIGDHAVNIAGRAFYSITGQQFV